MAPETRPLASFDWALKRLLRSKASFDILEGFLSELLHDNIKVQESRIGRETSFGRMGL